MPGSSQQVPNTKGLKYPNTGYASTLGGVTRILGICLLSTWTLTQTPGRIPKVDPPILESKLPKVYPVVDLYLVDVYVYTSSIHMDPIHHIRTLRWIYLLDPPRGIGSDTACSIILETRRVA